MDIPRILTFAKISNISYLEPIEATPQFAVLGYKTKKFFDHDGAQAYLLESTDDVIIAFRGTQIKQKSDVLADLQVSKDACEIGGKIHHGFREEADKLWNNISGTLNRVKKPIHITGHSLGAAIATIIAAKLMDRTVSLVTFGSPRVGNKRFTQKLKVKHTRVRNNNDTVTKIPFESLGFYHHGECLYLNYYGNISKLSRWQMIKDNLHARVRAWKKLQFFKGLYDHSMDNYISKLDRLSKIEPIATQSV